MSDRHLPAVAVDPEAALCNIHDERATAAIHPDLRRPCGRTAHQPYREVPLQVRGIAIVLLSNPLVSVRLASGQRQPRAVLQSMEYECKTEQ